MKENITHKERMVYLINTLTKSFETHEKELEEHGFAGFFTLVDAHAIKKLGQDRKTFEHGMRKYQDEAKERVKRLHEELVKSGQEADIEVVMKRLKESQYDSEVSPIVDSWMIGNHKHLLPAMASLAKLVLKDGGSNCNCAHCQIMENCATFIIQQIGLLNYVMEEKTPEQNTIEFYESFIQKPNNPFSQLFEMIDESPFYEKPSNN